MRNLKRFRYLAVLLTLALAVSSCGSYSDEAAAADCELNQVDGDLALYNWAEYIDE